MSTAALVSIGPRAVAAVALTAAFAVLAPNEGSLDTGHQRPELPDPGTLQDPLGISGGLGGVKNLTPTDAVKLAANAEELSIPPVALAAYQRSSTVLNDADASCRLDWALVAAIGMVESNHGRFGSSELNAHGLAVPAIIGPQLNGAGNYAAIHDTDNGLYDRDTVYDHAVGPMQFIPSTWTYAGADGDGDNRRDPQDIDDAAVATAAFLCAGTEDVSTTSGANAAVYRYNQSDTYVEAVQKIAGQYRNGEFPGSPNVDGGSPLSTRPTASPLPRTPNTVAPTPKSEAKTAPTAAAKPPAPAPTPTPAPSKPADTDDTDPDTGTGGSAGEGETTKPTPTPTPTPADPPTSEEPDPEPEPEPTVESRCEEAVTNTYPDLKPDDETYTSVVNDCVTHFNGTVPTLEEAEDYVRGLREDPAWKDKLPEPTPDNDEVSPEGAETESSGEASPTTSPEE
ncbi:MAG: lytic transglycosylase domain-containing protein [Nocardioides sp.]|nr:lytic transglycosylase domain-containing protein [Nocardioides sp.]